MDHNNLGYLRYFQNKVTPFSTKLSWLVSEVTNIAWKLCAKSLSYGRIIIACCFISFRRILIKNYIFSIILLIRWNSHYHFFFYTLFCYFYTIWLFLKKYWKYLNKKFLTTNNRIFWFMCKQHVHYLIRHAKLIQIIIHV